MIPTYRKIDMTDKFFSFDDYLMLIKLCHKRGNLQLASGKYL